MKLILEIEMEIRMGNKNKLSLTSMINCSKWKTRSMNNLTVKNVIAVIRIFLKKLLSFGKKLFYYKPSLFIYSCLVNFADIELVHLAFIRRGPFQNNLPLAKIIKKVEKSVEHVIENSSFTISILNLEKPSMNKPNC